MTYDYLIHCGAVKVGMDKDNQYFCTENENSKIISYWDDRKKNSDILTSFINVVQKEDSQEKIMKNAIEFCEKFGLLFPMHRSYSNTVLDGVREDDSYDDSPLIQFDRLPCCSFFEFRDFISDLSDLAILNLEDSNSQDPDRITAYLKHMLKIMTNPICEFLFSNGILIAESDTTYLYDGYSRISYLKEQMPYCSTFELLILVHYSALSQTLNMFHNLDRYYGKHLSFARGKNRNSSNLLYEFYTYLLHNIPLSDYNSCPDVPLKISVPPLHFSTKDICLINSFVPKFITDHINSLIRFVPSQLVFQAKNYSFGSTHTNVGSLGPIVHALALVLESQADLKRCVYCNRAFFPDYKHPQQETCGKDCSKARYDRDKRAKRKLEREAERDFPNIKKIEYK